MDAYNELTYIINSFRHPNETTDGLIERIINDEYLLHACASVCSSLNCNMSMVRLLLQLPYFKQRIGN